MVIDHQQIVEALLFASDGPLSGKKIREIIPEIANEKEVRKIIGALDELYQKNNQALKVIELAGGYQIVTREELASWIAQLYKNRSRSRLTRKGLETLAIIAYKQPIAKAEVDAIRGVGSDGVIRTLIERNLVTVKGRKKAPGNPLLYGTTTYFLEFFGLKSLKDLPTVKEIDELLKSDSQFLESLDQVALEQILPEKLGLTSIDELLDNKQDDLPEGSAETADEENNADETPGTDLSGDGPRDTDEDDDDEETE